MTQGISVYKSGGDINTDNLVYHTVHERNGDYLEREHEPDKFLMLKDVDDCDPSSFYTPETLQALMDDLDIVISEAETKQDTELANHLKEIMVLCKLCLWNIGKFTLVISPFEYIPPEKYPLELPRKHKVNISLAGCSPQPSTKENNEDGDLG